MVLNIEIDFNNNITSIYIARSMYSEEYHFSNESNEPCKTKRQYPLAMFIAMWYDQLLSVVEKVSLSCFLLFSYLSINSLNKRDGRYIDDMRLVLVD